MSTLEKFWFEKLRAADKYEWPKWVLKKHLFEDYREFAKGCGERYPLIDQQLGKELHLLCPGIKSARITSSQSRYRVYLLPDLDTCRAKFEKVIGVKVDWDAGVEINEGPEED